MGLLFYHKNLTTDKTDMGSIK